jgi:hypothetical protein
LLRVFELMFDYNPLRKANVQVELITDIDQKDRAARPSGKPLQQSATAVGRGCRWSEGGR